MATLKELAERTGYSSATISRILTGDPSLSVTPEARRKVLEEAGRLNYRATRSRRGRTPKALLQVGMAEMLTPEQQMNDPYYLYLGNLIRQYCAERKYTCLPLEQRGEAFVLAQGSAEGTGHLPHLDGIVAVGIFTLEQIQALAQLTPNVVFLDSSPDESQFDCVVLGYELGISLALEHLIDLGHRRIGFIGPEYKLDDHKCRAPEVRRKAFLRLMEEHGLLDQVALWECPMESEATAQAVQKQLRSNLPRPSAFLCANEESAIGALRAFQQANLSIPDDISVVSFNDTPRSELLEPPLTSVHVHVEEMASTALRLLAERAILPQKPPVRTLPLKVIAPPTLVVRRSTGHL